MAAPNKQSVQIIRARSKQEIEEAVRLFDAYVKVLADEYDIKDLSFQNWEEELAGMPGKYAPPRGELFLARSPADPPKTLGVVGLRPLDVAGRCELKRLFVTADARGSGAGAALTAEAIRTAVGLGYREMVLDTHKDMNSAIRLYNKMGFVEIPAYYHNPYAEARYFGLKLEGSELPN